MLIVCSLENVDRAYAENQPSRVISLLSEDEVMPSFEGLADGAHLKLYVERDDCSSAISSAAERRAREIVNFVNNWDGDGDILVHCNRGVSRSMAAAFVVLCMLRPSEAEAALAAELRAAAPHADPCVLIVAFADELLDRDGRMIDAIEDLSPPCAEIAAPLLTLPLAA